MARGNIAVTLKTVGPMPISLALATVFVLGARARSVSRRRETS
jgi:hypothetical protein